MVLLMLGLSLGPIPLALGPVARAGAPGPAAGAPLIPAQLPTALGGAGDTGGGGAGVRGMEGSHAVPAGTGRVGGGGPVRRDESLLVMEASGQLNLIQMLHTGDA
eukprot:scaffold33163_cov90-Isochrysis_galbana.AAC.2